MKVSRVIFLFLFSVFFVLTCFGQQGKAPIKIDVIKLTEKIYKIECYEQFQMNLIVLVDDEGILLVDSMLDRTANKLRSVIDELGNGKLKYLINTHWHGDHSGGNAHLDSDELNIISDEKTRAYLLGDYFYLKSKNVKGLPNITVKNSMTIYFGGEEIVLTHTPPTHTDGDVIVYFTKSGILFLGDVVIPDSFPYVDLRSGGDVIGYAENIKRLIVDYPSDTKFLSAHGRDYSVSDLKKYHNMLQSTISIIKKEIDAGKSIDEILKADVLKDWHSWGESFPLISTDAWVRNVFNGLLPKPETVKVSICKPLTKAIVEKGIESAVKKYQTLKTEKQDLYDFSELQLNILGYQLINRKMMDEAIEIFKLNVKAYPNSSNVHDSLGETYAAQGKIKLAIEFYNKALERDTENVRIKNIIKNLLDKADK